MRPIEKGSCPQENGTDLVFSEYEDARGSLIERLGEFCSFCEMHLDSNLAVEHRLPQSVARYKPLALEWTNFLLACVNCNSTKGRRDIEKDDYFWPDQDNTFYALRYGPGALVEPNDNLPLAEKQKAMNLIQLVGLDRLPGNLKTASDRRWLNREEAWGIAQRQQDNLKKSDTPELRDSIAHNAYANGYFSVWITVFATDEEMCQRIIERFPGTVKECFHSGRFASGVSR